MPPSWRSEMAHPRQVNDAVRQSTDQLFVRFIGAFRLLSEIEIEVLGHARGIPDAKLDLHSSFDHPRSRLSDDETNDWLGADLLSPLDSKGVHGHRYRIAISDPSS